MACVQDRAAAVRMTASPESASRSLAHCASFSSASFPRVCRSEIIGDGCEMLVLLFGPGIVGGLIVPILGAI